MKPEKFDFGGYATKNDIQCTDGRTIRRDAFQHDDGKVVPLVWQHGSRDPSNILGHAYLENRNDGVYAYCVLNDSINASNVKGLIQHSAINALSIYANKLGQIGKDVMSGVIREVSTVMSGANPGALIDTLAFSHGDFDDDVDEAIIYTGENIALSHSSEPMNEIPQVPSPAEVLAHVDAAPAAAAPEQTVGDVLATMDEMQQAAVGYLLDAIAGGNPDEGLMQHADTTGEDGPNVGDVLDSLDEDQKAAVGFLISELENDMTDMVDAVHSEMEYDYMETNIFDQTDSEDAGAALTHADFEEITELAKKRGSFKDAFIEHMEENGYELQHANTYGLDNIGVLFPDAKSVSPTPDFIQRDNGWVGTVMNGCKHSPFARIKSLAADITPDEARAKGYVTGNEKTEEVFELLTRSTTPTTIYKKQKLDRDDVVDITDFDVISWLRSEMRVMLDEEIARAILIGDGRSSVSNDKIKEANIRPIYTDADLYAQHIDIVKTDPNDQIDEVVKAAKFYKGTGTPTFFGSRDTITDMLLVKDTLGRRLYNTKAELAAGLGVSSIVEVEPMFEIENPNNQKPLFGIIVNLTDYTIGADKGGEINAFDDFDIDFNQMKYLIETRISGALTKPKSALVLELNPAAPIGG